jgi:hypothetical protein
VPKTVLDVLSPCTSDNTHMTIRKKIKTLNKKITIGSRL